MKKIFSLYFVRETIVYLLVVIEILLGLKVMLEFVGANKDALFSQWLNYLTNPLTKPFINLFPVVEFGPGWPINVSIVFGMGIYLILAVILLYFVMVLEGKKN